MRIFAKPEENERNMSSDSWLSQTFCALRTGLHYFEQKSVHLTIEKPRFWNWKKWCKLDVCTVWHNESSPDRDRPSSHKAWPRSHSDISKGDQQNGSIPAVTSQWHCGHGSNVQPFEVGTGHTASFVAQLRSVQWQPTGLGDSGCRSPRLVLTTVPPPPQALWNWWSFI